MAYSSKEDAAAYYKNYSLKNRERRKAQQKMRYESYYKQDRAQYYQDNKTYFLEQRKEYYLQNKERCAASAKVWRDNNREYLLAAKKAYSKSHPRKISPDKASVKRNRRRAMKNAALGSYTAQEWLALKESHGNRCLCCGRPGCEALLTVDHVVPLSKGGTNFISNIQPLCQTCNSSKGTKTIDYRPGAAVNHA